MPGAVAAGTVPDSTLDALAVPSRPDAVRRAFVRAFARLPRSACLLWVILAFLGAYAIGVHLGGMAMAVNIQSPTPISAIRPNAPAAGNVTADCTHDNSGVYSDLLTYLHQRLGSSVVLFADTNTGSVVFYDPVNHVTVTETDMYEDLGYAEFNGDDYAVSGCAL